MNRRGRAFVLSLTLCALIPVARVNAEQKKAGFQPKIPTHATVRHDPRFEETRGRIMERVAEDIPSFAIAVAQGGKIIWEEAFGWADLEARVEATPRTIYPIASIAKSVTATGVMVLRDRGALRLDDRIDRYVEKDMITPAASKVSDVTVRQVLSMTAGFPMGFKKRLADNHEKRIQEGEKAGYKPTTAFLGSLRDFVGESVEIEMLFQKDGDIHTTIDSQFTALV